MKVLVLTTSCAADRGGSQQVARETWVGAWGHLVDHRFVLGKGNRDTVPSELIVDAPDDYFGVPFKDQAAWHWAIANGYDYVFQTSVDTYVAVPRLLQSGFEQWDYIGRRCTNGPHASGGAGYWLSRKALDILVAETPHRNYEDLWVGETLASHGIPVFNDERYWAMSYDDPPFQYQVLGAWNWGTISVHLGRGTGLYDPTWMRDCHRSFLNDTPL